MRSSDWLQLQAAKLVNKYIGTLQLSQTRPVTSLVAVKISDIKEIFRGFSDCMVLAQKFDIKLIWDINAQIRKAFQNSQLFKPPADSLVDLPEFSAEWEIRMNVET